MLNMQVKIDGLDNLEEALRRAPELTVSEIGGAIQKSLVTISSQAKREAPVNKGFGGGTLRQKISMPIMLTKLRGKVESTAPYSIYVHEGTRKHIIRPRIKKGLANVRMGKYFGKIVKHPGTKANPFFKRAFDKSESKMSSFFNKALENIIKSFT